MEIFYEVVSLNHALCLSVFHFLLNSLCREMSALSELEETLPPKTLGYNESVGINSYDLSRSRHNHKKMRLTLLIKLGTFL